MPSLRGTKTEQNLKDAFAAESEANGRYLRFARKADVEGFNELAALFRLAAAGRTRHAHGHLDCLAEGGDPATGHIIWAAITSAPHEYIDMYPGMARMAR